MGGNLHSGCGVVTVTPTNIPCEETCEGYGQARRKGIRDDGRGVVQQECPVCRRMLPASAFTKNKHIITGMYAGCKRCHSARSGKTYMRDPVPIMVRQIVLRSKKRGIFCDLTYDDVRAAYDEQAGRCCYTGLAFGDTGTMNALSVDRIVPERGYTEDTTVLCLLWVNPMTSGHPASEFFSKIVMIAKNTDRLRSQARPGPYLEGLQLEIGVPHSRNRSEDG